MDRPTVALNWGTPRRARTATFIRLSTQSDRLANVESSRALRPSKTRHCPSRFSVQPLLQHQPRRLLYTPPCLRPLRCVAKPVLRRQLQWLCVFLSRQPLLAAFSPCREPTEARTQSIQAAVRQARDGSARRACRARSASQADGGPSDGLLLTHGRVLGALSAPARTRTPLGSSGVASPCACAHQLAFGACLSATVCEVRRCWRRGRPLLLTDLLLRFAADRVGTH